MSSLGMPAVECFIFPILCLIMSVLSNSLIKVCIYPISFAYRFGLSLTHIFRQYKPVLVQTNHRYTTQGGNRPRLFSKSLGSDSPLGVCRHTMPALWAPVVQQRECMQFAVHCLVRARWNGVEAAVGKVGKVWEEHTLAKENPRHET